MPANEKQRQKVITTALALQLRSARRGKTCAEDEVGITPSKVPLLMHGHIQKAQLQVRSLERQERISLKEERIHSAAFQ